MQQQSPNTNEAVDQVVFRGFSNPPGYEIVPRGTAPERFDLRLPDGSLMKLIDRDTIAEARNAAWHHHDGVRRVLFADLHATEQARDQPASLERELASLLNRHSAENGSNTPDFLLAEYLLGCLALYNKTVLARAHWYGRMDRPGQSGSASSSAEALWKLLDDIDTADDQIKPLDPASGPDALARFRDRVMAKVAQRHEILSSDGYGLSAVIGVDMAAHGTTDTTVEQVVVLGDMSEAERHACKDLAELGVLDPPTPLLRAQVMLEHAKNAHDLSVMLGSLEGGERLKFTMAEESAARTRNKLLRETPMGASFADKDILASMARDAAKEVGSATMVTVVAGENINESRYVRYLLRCPNGVAMEHYGHGLAVVTSVWANYKQHVFPRPILIAAGEGLKDSRRPFDYADLVKALHAAGLVTNDRLGAPTE